MLASSIPVKIGTIFAEGAGGSYITNPLPVPSQIGISNGRASFTDGFPPWCFQAGGYPWGEDFNGLLYMVTAWLQWQSAGGLSVYDGTFSSEVGGYPKGAILASSVTTGLVWLNLADNNTTNPDSSGSNWVEIPNATTVQNGVLTWTGVFGGSANALTATLSPAPSSLVSGLVVRGLVSSSPNTGAATINVNSIGTVAITRADGTALQAGDLQAGAPIALTYNATTTAFEILGLYTSQSPPRNLVSHTSHGSGTFTVPAGIYWIYGTVVGAGGGGGGGGGSASYSGGGGGSGGYSAGWLPVTPGQTVSYVVGQGGAGGNSSSGSVGTAGGSSSLGTLSATGGAGGTTGTSSCAGGTPGVGSGGQLNLYGANGGDGNPLTNGVQGGQGAASALGGGGRTATASGAAGQNGLAPGSGGGGIWSTGPSTPGGTGADGAVIIQY